MIRAIKFLSSTSTDPDPALIDKLIRVHSMYYITPVAQLFQALLKLFLAHFLYKKINYAQNVRFFRMFKYIPEIAI